METQRRRHTVPPRAMDHSPSLSGCALLPDRHLQRPSRGTIRRTQWLETTTHPWMNLDAMVYQGRGSLERSTKQRRPPAKIANRLRPHLVRWRKRDLVRSSELRATGLMATGEQIRFVGNRTNDGQPLAGKI